MLSSADPSRSQTVQLLRERIGRLELPAAVEPSYLSCGSEVLDGLLPFQLRRGVLVEWLSAETGSGASTLALMAAREACQAPRACVVVDRRGEFYPPAAASQGLDLGRLIVVRPQSTADGIWALDQALRCAGVGAVVNWQDRLDALTFRRLQLAAATGGTLGLLIRPESARREPSWAEVRWLVQPLPTAEGAHARRRLRVELLRARGGAAGGAANVEIDHETGAVRLAASLAPATTDRRAART